MARLNSQVIHLERLAAELEGKESTVDRHSARAHYPIASKVPELELDVLVAGRAPVPAPVSGRNDCAHFVSPAVIGVTNPGTDDVRMFVGMAFLTVTPDRLLGLLMPDDDAKRMFSDADQDLSAANDAALAFASTRGAITVSVSGEKGLFRKKPSSIGLETDYWSCHVGFGVNRLRLSDVSGPSYQSGQETGLVSALEAG